MRSRTSGHSAWTCRRASSVHPASRITSASGRCSRRFMATVTSRRDPDARGYFGDFGGRFVPETLMAPVEELIEGYLDARKDPEFVATLQHLLTTYVGRPTPLYEARRASGRAEVRLLLMT